MRPLGFHVSIAGGLPKAIERAVERECSCLQIFCGNPRAWATTERSDEEIENFRAARTTADLSPVAVHACYLINPCSPDDEVFRRSIGRMRWELETSARIGAEFYVIHPGSSKGREAEWTLQRAAESLSEALRAADASPCILLENTAGEHGPGGSFPLTADLIAAVEAMSPDHELGIAVDTCHAFAAGYDIRQPEEVNRLVEEIDSALGLSRLKLLHTNDARDPAGSGRDRHQHIGEGEIGDPGFTNLLSQPTLAGIPAILETPWESVETDLRNIGRLRNLCTPTTMLEHTCQRKDP
jgi:deoxyribonuclease-4